MSNTLNITCPRCSSPINISNITATDVAPMLRSKMRPKGSILIYEFTSRDVEQFIINKSKKFIPDAKVEVVPIYCERKRKKDNEPRHSYVTFRVAFSEDIVENGSDLGWYGTIGNSDKVNIEKSLYNAIIKRYAYDEKDIDAKLKDYNELEKLEESLGITEKFLLDIKEYIRPKKITTEKGVWRFFSARTENILEDMFIGTDKKPAGRIKIQDVCQISKDVVKFIVYLYPQEVVYEENSYVRRLITGEEKIKNKD